MPNRMINLAGQRFEKLAVIKLAPKKGRRTAWLCQCDCGESTIVTTVGLRKKVNPIRSCGCLNIERTREVNTTHGMHGTREYSVWNAMLTRCRNSNSKDYARYGAVGIRVCERWETFENFYADMGPRPTGMTIERDDVTGDYCPGNCRWASYQEQAQNRSSNVFVTLPVGVLERLLGFTQGRLMRRLDNGWDLIKAVSTKAEPKYDSYRERKQQEQQAAAQP